MTITIARTTDADALSAVARATFLDSYAHMVPWTSIARHNAAHNSPEGLSAAMDKGAVCWLARMEKTDAPVALAMMTEPDLPVETGFHDTELKRIYALSCAQGQGVGRRLLDAVEDEARARGHTRLLLGVYHENPTIAWYRRRGFEEVGTRSFTVGTDVFHDLILGKGI